MAEILLIFNSVSSVYTFSIVLSIISDVNKRLRIFVTNIRLQISYLTLTVVNACLLNEAF